MSDQQCRTRKCYVCYGKVSSRATNDNRRHNCVSLGEALCGELPDECWQLQHHPYVLDILRTITACQQKGKHSDIAHQRRVELAKIVLSATETGQLDKKVFFERATGFSSRQLKAFLDALPESSYLRDLLAQPVAEITKPKPQEKAPKPKKPLVELPPEFEKALGMYAEASERRAKLKVERGHEYDSRTAIRRIEDARRFCEFLTQHGITRWADVAARHLDDYIVTMNRHAAQRAWTFLNFLHGRVPMLAKIPRPRDTPRHSGAMVALLSDAKKAIACLVKHPDLQVAIAGLFLAMYAQTIAHSCTLKLNQFRRQDGSLQAKFHGDWMPLDPLTDQLICRYRPEYADDGYTGADQPFFSLPCFNLKRKVAATAGVPLKPLRLAAISNLLRSGMTDRGAIVYYLGVSMPTIEDVERTTYWDLQSTVPPEVVEARNEVIRGERSE